MPKPVKLGRGREFTFKATPKGGGEGRYPWDTWLNGDLLLLEQSTGEKDDKGNVIEVEQKRDYEVNTNQMVPKLKTAGRKRYKVVQVSRLDVDGKKLVDSLIIKARDMTEDERLAEDEQRIVDRQATKDRLAEARAKKAAESAAPSDTVPMQQTA